MGGAPTADEDDDQSQMKAGTAALLEKKRLGDNRWKNSEKTKEQAGRHTEDVGDDG